MINVKSPKKLIEVALPLDDINAACAYEKMPGIGAHPRGIHLWWARRPLAAARAVLFAQMVNDPGYQQGGGFKYGVNKEAAAKRREKLFDIIRDLVKWENTNNEAVLERARKEIRRSWREVCELNKDHPQAAELFNPDKLPAFHDPFAGGGAIPLEAQRLGLEAWASDLNPVAVMINKAMIEIPPRFAGRPPVFRNEWREVRNERGAKSALSGDEGLEQGHDAGTGSVPLGATTAQGGDLRHEIADHAGGGVGAGEHRGGLDAGVEAGKGSVPRDCTGIDSGSGNLVDPVRANRLVPGAGNRGIARAAGGSQQNAHGNEKATERKIVDPLFSHSSSLFPGDWPGATGLAEDVRRYGHWMREQAERRIGHLYPKVKITREMIEGRQDAGAPRPDLKQYEGQELTVIAWLWARTVKSPNPAFSHVDVPLASSFVLSSKKGKEAWVEPVIHPSPSGRGAGGEGYYRFEVRVDKPPAEAKNGTKLGRGANFRCLLSGSPIEPKYIKAEGKAGRMGARLMAIVAEGNRQRVYLPPTEDMETVAKQAQSEWKPETPLPDDPRNFWTVDYGLTTYGDLFTPRQLVSLTTFSDLVQEARAKVIEDARKSGWDDDGEGLDAGGTGATAYGDAVAVYLAFCVDRCADFNNSLTGWRKRNEKIMYLFSRQAIPMVWDFGEANILENVVGGFITNLGYQTKCLLKLAPTTHGHAEQLDAATQTRSKNKVVSTDPPYYDNIGYADLSDFFYIWMRRSLKPIYPSLFATLAVPKAEELVATPYRHGSKEKAEEFFLEGMKKALHNLADQAHPAFPISVYYAFKQAETRDGSTISTGWETFLEAVIQAGFSIDGTWPMRSEQSVRMIGMGTNALASSVILVCRKRSQEADSISRKDFQRQLRREMPEALEAMTCLSADLPADSSQAGGRQVGGSEGLSARQAGASPIAPVDLAQAAIGPGMAIFSRYEAILNQDGSRMTVHDALILINRAITEYLSPESGSFDADTQFCSAWFEQYGWKSGPFGEADVLARAKGTSVDGVVEAGVLESGGGKVRLLKWKEYPADWDPTLDERTPVWEALHHMIRRLNEDNEAAAGELLARMPEKGEPMRQLAYHLYTLCERAGWAEDARAYNELIGAWHAIVTASHEVGRKGESLELDL